MSAARRLVGTREQCGTTATPDLHTGAGERHTPIVTTAHLCPLDADF